VLADVEPVALETESFLGVLPDPPQGGEAGNVIDLADDLSGADRADTVDVTQAGPRRRHRTGDPFLGCGQRLVQSGNVCDELTGYQQLALGHLIGVFHVAERHVCLCSRDCCAGSARFELKQQRVQPDAVSGPELSVVAVTFDHQSKNPSMAIWPDERGSV